MICRCKAKDLDPDRPKAKQVWCLYTKDGSRLLGRHSTKSDAERQERAVHANRRGSIIDRLWSVMTLDMRK